MPPPFRLRLILGGVLGIGVAGLLSSCGFAGNSEGYRYELRYGQSAIMRQGEARAPRVAPQQVHAAIAAGNRIDGKPYRMGGGHARVEDSGYDCSGAVSYLLINSGLLGSPMTSSGFRRYGKRGEGKWITVYAKRGHAFITVGGLRLDTGYRGGGTGPVPDPPAPDLPAAT